jgi:hypothetical protein
MKRSARRESRTEKPKTIQKTTSLAAQLALDVAAEVDALLGSGASDGIDFEASETAMRRQVLGLATIFMAAISDPPGLHLTGFSI